MWSFNNRADLLAWQKLIVHGAPDRLVYSKEQLQALTNDLALNESRILDESVELMKKTVKPDVYFSRWDRADRCLRNMYVLGPYIEFSGTPPDEVLAAMERDQYGITIGFLRRYLRSVDMKVFTLKTVKGKANQYKKFKDSLVPYYGRLKTEHIDFIETASRNRLKEYEWKGGLK